MGNRHVCDVCGKSYKKKIARVVSGTSLCKSCFDKDTIECAECHDRMFSEDARYTHNDSAICSSCYESFYFVCDECCEIYHRNDLRSHDGYSFCSFDCLDSYCDREDEYDGGYDEFDVIAARHASPKEIEKVIGLLSMKEATAVEFPVGSNIPNLDDPGVKEIVEKVGKVLSPAYIFGMRDRDTFDIYCYALEVNQHNGFRPTIQNRIWLIDTPFGPLKVKAGIRDNGKGTRIGLSAKLRAERSEWCVDFVKKMTKGDAPGVAYIT